MINLLPPEFKDSMTFARRNRILLRWVSAACFGIVGIALVIVAGHVYINSQAKAYERQVEQMQTSLTEQELEQTQTRIGEIDNSVKLALQVLSKEIPFSELIRGIGSTIPSGAALQNLSIADVSGALDLQVVASDYQTATQVQVNLEDPNNGIFDKADIINITCGATTNEDGSRNAYPCQVAVRALFASDSPFLLNMGSRQ